MKKINHHIFRLFLVVALMSVMTPVSAQIGEHRNTFAVGGNAGYILSNVGFVPTVAQGLHGGPTVGFSWRYTCEKYFSTICSIYGEVNYASTGWKENIVDINDVKVVDPTTGSPQEYSRTINYVQVPVMAHLAWGKENRGLNFFVNAGPQFGYYLSESSSYNFDLNQEIERIKNGTSQRSSSIYAQDTMQVKNKLDYGIAAGLGLEYSVPKVGHFMLTARYYYGLGNIYGSRKRDVFSKSNHGNIVIKATYLIDL